MARPDQAERRYRRELLAFVDQLTQSVRNNLVAVLPVALMEQDAQTRVDGWVETLEAAIARIPLAFARNIAALERETLEIGREIADFNEGQWRAVMRKAVGVDFMRSEPWLADEIKSFAAENAALIRSIPEQVLTRVQGIAQSGVRRGESAKSMEAEIMKAMDTTRARARLIARDQTSKLNGQITQRRQQAIGAKTYYWDTSGDERVRESHRVLDGMLCKWDDDSVYSSDGGNTWRKRSSIGGYVGKPGEDIQCRCGARSDTRALLDELGL